MLPHIKLHLPRERKLTSTNLHKIFPNLHNSHSIFNLQYTHRLPSLNHSKQNTFIILLWYSSSSGIFCRVQSNALLIWALLQYNILIDALLKVRQDMEGHWSALGMRNRCKRRKDPETWSTFLSPYLTKLSPGCQLVFFFFFFRPAALWAFQGPELLEESDWITFIFFRIMNVSLERRYALDYTLNPKSHSRGKFSTLGASLHVSLLTSLIFLDVAEKYFSCWKWDLCLFATFFTKPIKVSLPHL